MILAALSQVQAHAGVSNAAPVRWIPPSSRTPVYRGAVLRSTCNLHRRSSSRAHALITCVAEVAAPRKGFADVESEAEFLAVLEAGVAAGKIPKQLLPNFMDFYNNYKSETPQEPPRKGLTVACLDSYHKSLHCSVDLQVATLKYHCSKKLILTARTSPKQAPVALCSCGAEQWGAWSG